MKSGLPAARFQNELLELRATFRLPGWPPPGRAGLGGELVEADFGVIGLASPPVGIFGR